MASQLPTWTADEGQSYGWIPDGGALSGVANHQMSPWEEDYFASVAVEAAEHGNQNAVQVVQWMSNWFVGRFEAHSGWNTYDGSAYRLIVTDGSGNVLQNWGAIETATQAAGCANGSSWTPGNYEALSL